MFHSYVIFIIPTLAFEQDVLHLNGEASDLWSTGTHYVGIIGNAGTVIYTCVILVVTFKLALEARNWTTPFQLALWLSVVAWILWLLIYSIISLVPFVTLGTDSLFVTYNLFDAAPPYFVIVMVMVIALFRDFAWKLYAFFGYFFLHW